MTRFTLSAGARRLLGRRLAAGLAFLLPALAPVGAAACEIWSETAETRAAPISPAELPESLAAASLRCGEEARPVLIWTLAVDGRADHLGVRDAPLFRTDVTGPLQPLAEAEIPGAARLAVHVRASVAAAVRASGAQAPSYRRFATFCDAGAPGGEAASTLDCSLNGARVKARATAEDADRDGVLDRVNHEVSLYLGGDRLHVVYFSEDYREAPLSGAAAWIDVLNGFTVLPPGV